MKHLKILNSILHLESKSSFKYPSETSKCRSRLSQFCKGYGLDLGFGGDPIVSHAIRIDLERPYSNVGDQTVQLGGNAATLFWFRESVLDFIYSSHLLEDFEDTESILREWLRVLKPGGKLILFCPDEQIYRLHCLKTNQPYNVMHKIPNFSLGFVKNILLKIGYVEIIHECALTDDYSWELVCVKK